MKLPDAVSASVEVALDPVNAFAVFTEEINRWWRPGPMNWNDSARAVGIHIEPGVGGRWIEVYDEATGEGFECGRLVSSLRLHSTPRKAGLKIGSIFSLTPIVLNFHLALFLNSGIGGRCIFGRL